MTSKSIFFLFFFIIKILPLVGPFWVTWVEYLSCNQSIILSRVAKFCWLKRGKVNISQPAIIHMWGPKIVTVPSVWLTLWLETKLRASVAKWRARTEITHGILLKCIFPPTPPNPLALSLNWCPVTEQPRLQALEFFKLWLQIPRGKWKVKHAHMQSARRRTHGLVHNELCNLNYSVLSPYWFEK